MIPFFKYQATGNDFVLIDNRGAKYGDLTTEQVKWLCDRRFGIGGDGLMLLNHKEGYDFDMKYYNSDGREGSMCGNGGRSIVRFAHRLGLIGHHATFTAADGVHEGTLGNGDWVRLKMSPVHRIIHEGDHYILDTGSPHYVTHVEKVEGLSVRERGAEIRYSGPFAEKGINVNFVELNGDGSIFVRTYERGVEDETYSCGTGVTASALVGARAKGPGKVDVQTLGGRLQVEFTKVSDNEFEDIWLCGDATFVFSGEIELPL
jgi:diaminopimelate epimerase